MKYRELGTTRMNISQITLGTWGMGDVGWDHYDESTRIDAIRTAAQCGVNLIDTAPAYNNGAAERLVGRAGCRASGRRSWVQSVWPEGQGAEYFAGRAGCKAFCRKDREDPIRWREAGTGFYLKIYYIAGRFCNGT